MRPLDLHHGEQVGFLAAAFQFVQLPQVRGIERHVVSRCGNGWDRHAAVDRFFAERLGFLIGFHKAGLVHQVLEGQHAGTGLLVGRHGLDLDAEPAFGVGQLPQPFFQIALDAGAFGLDVAERGFQPAQQQLLCLLGQVTVVADIGIDPLEHFLSAVGIGGQHPAGLPHGLVNDVRNALRFDGLLHLPLPVDVVL